MPFLYFAMIILNLEIVFQPNFVWPASVWSPVQLLGKIKTERPLEEPLLALYILPLKLFSV